MTREAGDTLTEGRTCECGEPESAGIHDPIRTWVGDPNKLHAFRAATPTERALTAEIRRQLRQRFGSWSPLDPVMAALDELDAQVYVPSDAERAARALDPTNHHNAAKCPYCSPERAARAEPGLREALDDLLWWSEHMQREDRFSGDLADTDEEADRRWQLMQTFGDHEKRAMWLRGVIGPSSALESSGSGLTSGLDAPNGLPSPAFHDSAALEAHGEPPRESVVERLDRPGNRADGVRGDKSLSRMTLTELRNRAEATGLRYWNEEWTRQDFIHALAAHGEPQEGER